MSGPNSSPVTGFSDLTLDGARIECEYRRTGHKYAVTKVWAGGWIEADEAFTAEFRARMDAQLTREFAAEFAGQLEGTPA